MDDSITTSISARPYQNEAIESILNARSLGIHKQLVLLPTGTGKTIVFAMLAKELNTRTLIVANSEELINQAVAKLKLVWPEADCGICKAEKDEITHQVVVASIQTATRDKRLERLKEQNFGLMIIDECHHSAAPSYEAVIRELGFLDDPTKLLIGVTATSARGDGQGLGSIFQEIVFERSLATMVRSGYLSSLIGKQIETKVDLKGVGVRAGDFIAADLSMMVNTTARNQLIVDQFEELAHERKKALAFTADVQHAKDLAETFNQRGIPTRSVYGSMDPDERKQVLSDFSQGKYRVLTNCMILVEGYDESSIDCLILGRPTKSKTLFTQMIGRGTRLHPGKRDCLILDFADNTSRHDLCSCKNSLDGAVKIIVDEFENGELKTTSKGEIGDPSKLQYEYDAKVNDIDLLGSTHFAWIPVGESWHLCLSSTCDIWARQVEGGFMITAQSGGKVFKLSSRPLPLDYAVGIGEDWARGQSNHGWAKKDAEWRQEPASPKQIEALSRFGLSFDENMISKGEAADLLSMRLSEPATPKQINFLKYNKTKFDPAITKIEASKLIAGMKNGR